jgi:putative 4-mercaptohistidine N1-methyltranferase
LNPYESPKLVAEYLLFHYGTAADILGEMPGPAEAANFATRLVRELLDPASLPPEASALDLGCAVGASAFELARTCTSVIGVDFSHAFIQAATTLRDEGRLSFEKTIEGDLTESATAEVSPSIDRQRVTFLQGDAMNLPNHLPNHLPNPKSKIPSPKSFTVLLAANLLCRLPEPMKLIDRLPSLVQTGGQLLLTTPFTWLEEFTPRQHWLGGTPATGRSFEALRTLLDPHFELEHTVDLPFLIREHARKFQYGVALGSRWRRR